MVTIRHPVLTGCGGFLFAAGEGRARYSPCMLFAVSQDRKYLVTASAKKKHIDCCSVERKPIDYNNETTKK